jgi:shikimate kinase
LNFAFVDTDQLVEARTHKSISSIFAEQGRNPAFRETEGKVVAELHRSGSWSSRQAGAWSPMR